MVTTIESNRTGKARGAILAAFVMAGVAGCTQTIMEESVAAGVTIRTVQVDATGANKNSIRGLPLEPAQIEADIRSAVETEIADRRARNGNADLSITVNRLHLVPPEQSFFAGGQSFIDATVTVVGRDGQTIAGPTKFSGQNESGRMGGIIGAISAPSPMEDYGNTLTGFAKQIREALFEGGATVF